MKYIVDKKMERVLKALANHRRLIILSFLKEKKEAPVGTIASHLKLSFKATSKHLAVLFSAEIVTKEQRSLLVFYRLSTTISDYTKAFISFL